MRSLSSAPRGRLLLALAGVLVATGALAQPAPADQPAPKPAPTATPRPAAPGDQAQPAPQLDEATREIIRREVEQAKQDLRNELRAEQAGQQAAKEFLQGAESEERKLQFFEVHGYLRFRADLFDHLELGRSADPGGFYLYPRPLINPDQHATLTNVNMRLRLEPTMNVSEQIRIHGQLDVLDNLVLGSTPDTLGQQSTSPIPLDTHTQLSPANSVKAKQIWAEVQTPVGLLAFGRQRADWGLGIIDNPGDGLDDDLGSVADRIQFAIPLRSTPVGPLTIIPMYDLLATGQTATNATGQAIDAEKSDDATAIGLKVVRVETAEERKLKLEQGRSTWAHGLYYSYRSQGYAFPTYDQTGAPSAVSVRRNGTSHVLDLWGRWEKRTFRLEWEAAYVLGQIENASNDPANPSSQVAIRQFGGVVQTAWTPSSRWTLSSEVGIASGDSAPGLGNHPGRGYGAPGSVDGAQYNGTTDRDYRNFRFNPAYRVDQVLWREILGNVTDAWYLKPGIEYRVLDGLALRWALVYSQAIYAESTPSARYKPLGLESDLGVDYHSDDGFHAWINWGFLQPLDGFDGGGPLSRAHAIRTGLAVKF